MTKSDIAFLFFCFAAIAFCLGGLTLGMNGHGQLGVLAIFVLMPASFAAAVLAVSVAD
jgi:hypothetical protein